MENKANQLRKAFAVIASLFAVSTPALAATNWNQSSFEQHLRTVSWGDGSTMKFEHLRQCDATVNHHSKLRNPDLVAHLEYQLEENEKQQQQMTNAIGNELTYGNHPDAGSLSARYHRLVAQRQKLIDLRYNVLQPALNEASQDYINWTTPKGYGCNSGYVTVTNPQGKKACKVTSVSVDEENYTRVRWNNCRWIG